MYSTSQKLNDKVCPDFWLVLYISSSLRYFEFMMQYLKTIIIKWNCRPHLEVYTPNVGWDVVLQLKQFQI